jgi:archaemetzincin
MKPRFLLLVLIFLALAPGRLNAKEAHTVKKILIVPLGDDINQSEIEPLREQLGKIYGAKVEFDTAIPMPAHAYERSRNQYYSGVILDSLSSRIHIADQTRVLAITNHDLTVPSLNFVFGQADIESGLSIISLARLRQEFYNERPDRQALQRRMLTEAVHEVGHTLGLDHCSNPRCVMYFSNTIQDTDHKGYGFCDRCRSALSVGAAGKIPR